MPTMRANFFLLLLVAGKERETAGSTCLNGLIFFRR